MPATINGAIYDFPTQIMKKFSAKYSLLKSYVITFTFVVGVSIFNWAMLPYLGYRALGSLFLLGILLVSATASRGPIFFAAVVSAFVWNFIFIPPTLTFAISSTEDIMMVVSFFITALIGGFLSEAVQTAKMFKVSETLQETLLNSVSHELRTPITALIGTATALKDERTWSDGVARAALIDELVRSATRLDRVVENLLDISRFQRGSLQLKKEWFDAEELIASVTSALASDIADRHVQVVKTNSILIEGDFELLSHAVGQVLLNAIKYSPDSASIRVELTQNSSHTSILVHDSGPGIPENLQLQIFEKFYRVPGTPTGGLGLGLAIAQTITELHGGKISARRGADVGSVFEVQLPTQKPPQILQEAVQ